MSARSRSWEANYVACMSQVWSHPHNEQRPAVIDWLDGVVPPKKEIADIGSGDPYYIGILRPQSYAFVEPLATLRKRCVTRVRALGIEGKGFHSIDALRGSVAWSRCDCILLIHSLYYLNEEELDSVHRLSARRMCVMVYPDPAAAETVAFEDCIGVSYSRRLVAQKERLFGEPTSRVRVPTHFRLSSRVSENQIAFLMSHVLDKKGWRPACEQAALRYVRSKRESWYRENDGWRIPQAQMMEVWE